MKDEGRRIHLSSFIPHPSSLRFQMLYPQSNPYRQSIDLSGIWDFRFDPDKRGAA